MAMTDEERFRFDLTGFLVRPSILTEDEVAAIREQLDRIHHDPTSLKPEERAVPGGVSSMLIDHPKVLDVLHDVIGPEVRLENAYSIWRNRGEAHGPMHGGGPMQADPLFGYRVQNGRVYAGITRVIFELSPIGKDDGATQFLVGSHKANFPVPPEHTSLDPDTASPFLMSYECPPGSAVFFTENIAHAGPPWRADHARVSVLFAYSHIATNYHRLTIPPEVVQGLSRRHQAFLRPVWEVQFGPGGRRNSYEEFLKNDDPPLESVVP
jgi:hypothetical protein